MNTRGEKNLTGAIGIVRSLLCSPKRLSSHAFHVQTKNTDNRVNNGSFLQ